MGHHDPSDHEMGEWQVEVQHLTAHIVGQIVKHNLSSFCPLCLSPHLVSANSFSQPNNKLIRRSTELAWGVLSMVDK